jgi:hypothetical protein
MSYVGKITSGGSTHLVGSTLYGTCATAAATAAKVVTCADFDQLMEGITIHVKFTYSNTVANPTLNVNSTGAKNIYKYGTTSPGTTAKTSWVAGSVISFTYDGSYWQMNDHIDDTNSDTKVRQTLATGNANRPLLLAYSDNTVTTSNVDNVSYRNNSIYANPSTGTLVAPIINTNDLTTPFIELKGSGVTTPYIDFHYNNSSADHTSRIVENASGVIDIEAPNGIKLNGTKISPFEWVTYTFESDWHGAISALKVGQLLLFSINVYCDNSIESWQEAEIAGAQDVQPTTNYDFAFTGSNNLAYVGKLEYDGGNLYVGTRSNSLPASVWISGSGWGFLNH